MKLARQCAAETLKFVTSQFIFGTLFVFPNLCMCPFPSLLLVETGEVDCMFDVHATVKKFSRCLRMHDSYKSVYIALDQYIFLFLEACNMRSD